jgi:limonene 1,2-monooxygenase
MVATRLAVLDQLSNGRAIGGLGPGQLPSDSHMLALDPLTQRDQLTEGAEVILKLLRGETVTATTDWFELRDARLQLLPYSVPELEMVIAATVSPAGPRNAGRFGTGMINFAAASEVGFEALRGHWAIAEEEAEVHGQTISRDNWRLMCLMHLAETEEQAIKDVEHGLPSLWEFIGQIAAFGGGSAPTTKELVEMVNGQGTMIGTPEMAVTKIRELADQSGGFGCFLMGLGDFGDHAATLRSIELFATHVIPEFRGQLKSLRNSHDWVLSEKREKAEKTRWSDEAAAAIQKAGDDYAEEKAKRGT